MGKYGTFNPWLSFVAELIIGGNKMDHFQAYERKNILTKNVEPTKQIHQCKIRQKNLRSNCLNMTTRKRKTTGFFRI